jgi:hypothetical protein
MKMPRRALWIAVLFYAVTTIAQTKPQLSSEPLTAEQMAVYRAFLASYDNGSGARVNLANKTVPFEPDDMDLNGCLQGLHLVSPDVAAIHALSENFLPEKGYRLVDVEEQEKQIGQNDPGTLIRNGEPVDYSVERGFSAGLLSLSEIEFSKNHRYAAFTFWFHCGRLCGHGATLIYENVDGKWKEARGKRCSFTMS